MNPYFSLSEKVYDITERYPELLIFWPPTVWKNQQSIDA